MTALKILVHTSLSDTEREAYQDSLAQITYYLKTTRWLERMDTTVSPSSHLIALNFLYQEGGLPDSTMDSLVAEMKKKFPDDESIQRYPKMIPGPPPSEASIAASARMFKLLGITPRPRPTQKRVKKTYGLTALKEGDLVDTLSVKGLDGKQIQLSDIKTEYVLIDFWAGWCGPCIGEIPYLKQALEKHGGELTVLAISLDMSDKDWREAIQKNDNGAFTHGFIGYDSDVGDLFKERFGITGIPASFLLDGQRRIIGTNFRRTKLGEKLDDLTR